MMGGMVKISNYIVPIIIDKEKSIAGEPRNYPSNTNTHLIHPTFWPLDTTQSKIFSI
jgi:hypothetical protein